MVHPVSSWCVDVKEIRDAFANLCSGAPLVKHIPVELAR